ncbi:MAG: hypothetical protein U9N34_04925, partial [Candidatus Cloacimonadota bacterium]|nr:hypothetical protein [Candidatus Cloacimonadota bacterium]
IIDSYLYNADIGYAYHHKIVNLGISSRFYMGHFNHYFEQDFVDEEMADTNFERYNELKSVAINIGFSRKLGKLSFGGFYSSSTNLAGKSELLFSQNVYLQDDEEFEFQLPARVGLGISYRAKNRMKYGFDIEYENWESTNSYDNYTNSTILKAGIAFDPLLGYGEWWQKIPLRFGVNYRNLPFEINENKVIETGGALGFSIPLKKNYQMIDCAIEYKKRGNQEDNGMQESSIMLNIGIQGFDIFHKKYNRTRKVDIPETDRFN